MIDPQDKRSKENLDESASYAFRFQNAADAFARETTMALRLRHSVDGLKDAATVRIESPRGYIVKLFLHIGLLPRTSAFAALARLTEAIAMRPELSLEEIIADFAETHSATPAAVSKIIDKAFNVYDPEFMEKVVSITRSQPMTTKDVLCDLAVTVRAEYYSQGYFNE